MATTSPATASKSSSQCLHTTTTAPNSHLFFKTVFLQDWWLVKSDRDFHGKRLAVGGIAFRERHAIRVFCSAPIVKRLDTFTLETSDGITIAIKSPINWSRTNQNGFSMEVCHHFLNGFPHYWEDYIAQYFITCTRGVPTNVSDFNENIIHSFDVRTSCNDSKNPGMSIHSFLTRSSAFMMGACFGEETASRCQKAKIENKYEVGKDFVDPENGVESTRVLFSDQQNNINSDGLKEPESIVSERNSIMKSYGTTDDVADNSILLESTEVNLLEVELQMPNSTSNKDEVGGTESILELSKRKGKSNSGQKSLCQRCSPKRLDSLKCDMKDKNKTKCGSNWNVSSHVEEKSCCGNSSSMGSSGLEETIDKSFSKVRKVHDRRPKRPSDSIVRRSSTRIRNLQKKLK
ncbi:uncharacterized protein LOC122068785 [Macadamia integrifolia]|uniref:uncharacterized protein LOC122068785 n=1 Tax=Macadamia integrifolia TaxID=60698 RepID=UPI001C4E5CFF|nr:uncharacterized protein LOC122068785 [Macadamia integrifolia]